MRWIFLCLMLVNIALFLWQLAGQPEAPNGRAQSPPAKTSSAVPMAGVDNIVLLSELKNTPPSVTSKPGFPHGSGGGNGERNNEPLCLLLGPFKKLLKAEYLVEHLSALDISVQVEELEIPGEPGYWVYLPPEISRKAALRKLHELQAKGVDSYVIPKGELANGISFGMFSQKSLALRRQQHMENQGYDAKIKQVTRTYKERWAILQPSEAEKFSDELWQKVLLDNPTVERRQNFCPSVASADNFH